MTIFFTFLSCLPFRIDCANLVVIFASFFLIPFCYQFTFLLDCQLKVKFAMLYLWYKFRSFTERLIFSNSHKLTQPSHVQRIFTDTSLTILLKIYNILNETSKNIRSFEFWCGNEYFEDGKNVKCRKSSNNVHVDINQRRLRLHGCQRQQKMKKNEKRKSIKNVLHSTENAANRR